MKPLLRWHHSRFGSVVLFLGGIRLAVPVLLLVAAAMGWGTWIESTRDADEAGRTVYGAWWFMALMGLVCMSLILSVVTRFPWRRKHVGFITVHASLVMLIISAFVSRFTRIEGRIVLAEGESASALQLDRTQIEVLRHNAGQFIPEDSVALDDARPFTVAGASVTVTARWANSAEEFNVTDDGANPLHAIELRPGNGEALWIGQSNPGEPPQDLDGVFVRVLPEGERWTPPPAAAGLLELRTDAGTRTTLSQPGVSLPGDWVVQRIQHFERAVVEDGTLIERDTGPANPAALVELAHASGSIERHIAFARFPDGIHKKTLAGETHSPFVLRYGGAAAPSPLVCFERIDGRSAVIVWTEARTERFERPGAGDEAAGTEPDHWRIDSDLVGSFVVLREYTRARGGTRLVEAPEAENSRPALVIAYMQGDHQHTAILPWTQRVPLQFGDEVRMLRYGPVVHALPFSIELADFRKMDYPGSDMAMAYESDVRFAAAEGAEPSRVTISMNRPLKHAGWKVYQSGFVGENVSVFQVMRDPGLTPTYVACIGLCIGIIITFYSRSFSRGHPGVPALFGQRTRHESIEGTSHAVPPAHRPDLPAAERTGPRQPSDQPADLGAEHARDPAHSAPGPDHAVVHVRAPRRGSTHRPHEVV